MQWATDNSRSTYRWLAGTPGYMDGDINVVIEVRSVVQLDARIIEARRLGFKRCVIPHSAKQTKNLPDEGIQLSFVKNLSDVFEQLF